jgi:hypothetical protein
VSPEPREPRLAGINVWSPEAERVASLLGDALGIGLRGRTADDGRHYSGRLGDLILSVHPGEQGHTELAFVVEEIGSAITRCAEHGGRVIEEPARLPYGISAHVAAPGALRIELVEPASGDE